MYEGLEAEVQKITWYQKVLIGTQLWPKIHHLVPKGSTSTPLRPLSKVVVLSRFIQNH